MRQTDFYYDDGDHEDMEQQWFQDIQPIEEEWVDLTIDPEDRDEGDEPVGILGDLPF